GGFAAVGVDPTCLYFPTLGQSAADSLLVSAPRGRADGRLDIQAVLDEIAPNAADQINPLDEVHDAMIYPFRIAFWIAGFLGALAMLFTLSGIYGVLSYVVSQRAREIGIRVALGAGGAAIIRMVMSQSLRFVALGGAVGAALALLIAPLFANKVEAI